jgi:hypothetical protein
VTTDKKKKAATPSAPVVDKKTADMFNAYLKQSAANNTGNATGAVYTRQEADATVQGVYQQMFGKNAMGADYNNALNAAMSQSQDTSSTGRQQAVVNYLQSTPEYKSMQEDKYLDAIYTKIQANVRKAQG